MQLTIRHGRRYRPARPEEILTAAAGLLVAEHQGYALTAPSDAVKLLRILCVGRPFETFAALWLDTRHRVLIAEPLFNGTIDGASVYPREVARRALEVNAAAVIFGHNHPSGIAEPSEADRQITVRLKHALGLIEIRLLDHVVLTAKSHVSLAERGLL